MFFQIILILSVLSYAFYKWATAYNDTFVKRGLPFERPWPLVGNFLGMMLKKESFAMTFLNFYNRNKKNKVTGFFNFREPVFMVSDPELIKKITVKDFDYFPNHKPFASTKLDKIMDAVLFNLKDQRWKNMRNTLTPAFTAAKMRAMFTLMNECFDESLQHFRTKSNNGEAFDLEMKECITRLSNDLIASTAFGLKINSYENRKNEFYTIGQTITSFRGKQLVLFLLVSMFPQVMDFLDLRIFDKKTTDYFTRLVVDAMKYREENKIVRPDMIQLLMEAQKESEQRLTDEEIVAQCFIFFFAAFENNTNLICITCNELMQNPNIQDRSYEEAKEIHKELNGTPLNYDILSKMIYMDMVVSETLRKFISNPISDRVCSKDYKLTDEENNLIFEFKQGDRIFIPLIGLRRDEKYFKEPNVFDPERFSDENKSNINPFAYMPFGVGPRACIGSRYALMQAKAMLYHLVLAYKMEPSTKSVLNLLDEGRGLQITPPSGFWIRFVPRS